MNESGLRAGPAHALRFNGPINNIHEAPAIGNGDMGALVQVFQDEFRLRLAKNDVYDARYDFITADYAMTQADLIRASRDYGFRLEGAAYGGTPCWDKTPPEDLRYRHWPRPRVSPSLKSVGVIRILHSGYSSTAIRTEVDIARGVVTAVYEMDFTWHGRGVLAIEAFVDRCANAIRIRIRRKGNLGDCRLVLEKTPDAGDASLPLPEVRMEDEFRGTLTQRIPDQFEAGPFAWHVAGVFPEPGPGRIVQPPVTYPHLLWQAANVEEDHTLEFMVGVATDRDGAGGDAALPRTGGIGDSRARALALAGAATAADYDRAFRKHVAAWGDFWAQSGIRLEDRELEATWYRNLFALGCQIAPHAMAPGIPGNLVPTDLAKYGGYCVNMNTQKMFLAALPTHHPEWIECYAGWLEHMLPSMRKLAQTIFGLEGIYTSHGLSPYVPPHRQTNDNQCGRALSMTGWLGQPLWWHWEYTRDRKFLEARAYPYLKAAAQFYWRYFEKFMDASGDIYPSLNLESPPWTRDFEHNRDCFIDLIMFRETFRWAIAAAEILGVDADWRQRWREGMARVRPLKFAILPDGTAWIYADKNDSPPSPAKPEAAFVPGGGGGQIAPDQARQPWWRVRPFRAQQAVTGGWTVFPGEYVDGDETEGLAPLIRASLMRARWHELHPEMVWIHHWWCAIPALRLGLPNAFAVARDIILKERFPAGHARTTHWINLQLDAWRCPEDNYLGAAATTEMLLQSQGGVLRLFPCWPKKKRAAFRDLPARGGFLVSAEWDPRQGLTATIRSLAGEECRIRWMERTPPRIRCARRAVALVRGEREVRFATRRGEEYRLRLGNIRVNQEVQENETLRRHHRAQ